MSNGIPKFGQRMRNESGRLVELIFFVLVVVVVLLFHVHGKHLRSCRDGQLT